MKALWAILPPLMIVFIGLSITTLLAFDSLIGWVGVPIFLLGIVDSWGRYNDYRYLKSCGWLPGRLADYYGRSFCGRWMVKAIALPMTSSGFRYKWKTYYCLRGYRWWHLFPDGFPSVLTKPTFWRNLVKGHT
jgi:hypothetical protein